MPTTRRDKGHRGAAAMAGERVGYKIKCFRVSTIGSRLLRSNRSNPRKISGGNRSRRGRPTAARARARVGRRRGVSRRMCACTAHAVARQPLREPAGGKRLRSALAPLRSRTTPTRCPLCRRRRRRAAVPRGEYASLQLDS